MSKPPSSNVEFAHSGPGVSELVDQSIYDDVRNLVPVPYRDGTVHYAHPDDEPGVDYPRPRRRYSFGSVTILYDQVFP